MRFEWDSAKDERNRRERGFGFDVVALIFLGETLEWRDDRKGYGETRFRAIGVSAGLTVHVVYTDHSGQRRIISARLASRKERDRWDARPCAWTR